MLLVDMCTQPLFLSVSGVCDDLEAVCQTVRTVSMVSMVSKGEGITHTLEIVKEIQRCVNRGMCPLVVCFYALTEY